MLSNDSEATLNASPLGDAEADDLTALDPRNPIEVASGGSGTTNDPPAIDKPPGAANA